MKRADLTGMKFARLTVLSYAGTIRTPGGQTKHRWHCLCDCGLASEVSSGDLKSGHVRSCGCLCRERASAAHFKHGKKATPEYVVWQGMRRRCDLPSHVGYQDYGGRGIRVCERWNDFTLFLADMGVRPSNKYSIDRIDNDGDYEPSNCRWTTRREQNNNSRHNHRLSFDGRDMTLSQWAEALNINASTLHRRLVKGWPLERALTRGHHANLS